MALSEQEQRALREIEQSLMAEDPRFGEAVGVDQSDFSGGASTGAFSLRGVALGLFGLLLLLGGVVLSEQSMWFIALSVVGFLVMFGAGIWMLRGGGKTKTGVKQAESSGRSARPSGAASPGGLSQRMEENFRKRFEN